MSNFEQKITSSDMSNQRLHISVLKAHLLDIKLAARYHVDELNQIVQDVNRITDQGLYKLSPYSKHFSNNPNDELPDNGIALLYVIPLTNEYIRQYEVIAADGKTTIITRLGIWKDSYVTWGKWRTYSDDNPFYEILKDTVARPNTNYLSFADHVLTLPHPASCKVGDVIRLDQWKGNGTVEQGDNSISTSPVITGLTTKMVCTGLSTEQITLERISNTLWESKDKAYRIDADIVHEDTGIYEGTDGIYWTISKNNIPTYRSVNTIYTSPTPDTSTYTRLIEEVINEVTYEIGSPVGAEVGLTLQLVESSGEENDIWSCNTYEFEIFNDNNISNPNDNYWCLFISNDTRNVNTDTVNYNDETFNHFLHHVTDLHVRITEVSNTLTSYVNHTSEILTSFINTTSEILTSYINVVSNNVTNFTTSSISAHDESETAHALITASITSTKAELTDLITSSISVHDANAQAHPAIQEQIAAAATPAPAGP